MPSEKQSTIAYVEIFLCTPGVYRGKWGVSPRQMGCLPRQIGCFTEANRGVSPLQMVRLQPRTEKFLHRHFPETKQLLKKKLLKIGQNLSQNHASHLPSINFQLCWLNLMQLQGKLSTSTASQWMLWKLKTRSLQNKRKDYLPTVNQGFGNPQLHIYIYYILGFACSMLGKVLKIVSQMVFTAAIQQAEHRRGAGVMVQ